MANVKNYPRFQQQGTGTLAKDHMNSNRTGSLQKVFIVIEEKSLFILQIHNQNQSSRSG
jgi:hypothetical protein